jgi:serine/threonine-protein kinase
MKSGGISTRILEPIRNSSVASALVYGVAFLVLATGPMNGALVSLEGALYDYGLGLTPDLPDPRVTVVGIDEFSMDQQGAWPWPRSLVAELVDRISAGGARAIVLLMDLTRPEAVDGGVSSQEKSPRDGERRLVRAINQADNVFLPIVTNTAAASRQRGSVFGIRLFESDRLLDISDLRRPQPDLAGAASGLGHIVMQPDPDGVQRGIHLLIRDQTDVVPALALISAAPVDGPANPFLEGRRVLLDELTVDVRPDSYWLPRFYAPRGGAQPFRADSASDVLEGRTPADKFNGKIVLVGVTSPAVEPYVSTPVGPAMSAVTAVGHQISSILQRDWLRRPGWVMLLEAALGVLAILYLCLGLPRLSALAGWTITLSMIGLLIAVELAFLLSQSIWLQLVTTAVFLLGGHLVLSLEGLTAGASPAGRDRTDWHESNRMMGLAYRQQGQLELAFERLQVPPLDEELMGTLYQLGLEAERRRKNELAVSIYQHLSRRDSGYRDVAKRIDINQRAFRRPPPAELPRASQKPLRVDRGTGSGMPKLGRYAIEREIGRSAMGIMYLGTDQQNGMQVAVKTFPLSDEFDETELGGVRERLLREGDAAARLNHPDIARVFAAGENDGLGYIVMEYVDAPRMSEFVAEKSRLPAERLLMIGARAAEALHYAHEQGVVHRDIKPANLLYNPVSDIFKITDFGVARSSNMKRTRTGVVMGTPSFMSPEQIAGETVTGHSDLFSLGVTLYQLLTAVLPFRADTLVQQMYKISNEPHQPIGLLRLDLPSCAGEIIDRALEKSPEDRFLDGTVMAAALRRCAAEIARLGNRRETLFT